MKSIFPTQVRACEILGTNLLGKESFLGKNEKHFSYPSMCLRNPRHELAGEGAFFLRKLVCEILDTNLVR